MNLDLTLTLSILFTAGVSAIGVYVAMRISGALTERRAQEAFDIAKQAREDLAAFKLEAARGFASIELLEKTESRLVVEIGKVVAEVRHMRTDLMGALKPAARRSRSEG